MAATLAPRLALAPPSAGASPRRRRALVAVAPRTSVVRRSSNASEDATEEAPSASTSSSSSSSSSPPPPASFPGPGPAYGGANTYADAQAIAPPSPRRVFLGVLGTTALALGGNFLGVTGALLDANPDLAARARLDIIYPVRGLKRCYNPEKGYEFSYPAAYLGDATMVSRAATQRERANPLDPPPLGAPAAAPKIFGQTVQEPQSAFGPVGGTGEENVSVIVSKSPPGGFRLDRFGDAENQAEWLLANVLARPGSGKTAELVGAFTRRGAAPTANYYTFEYTIKSEQGWFRHNVAVFAEFGGRLYTLVAQVPETEWETRRDDFRRTAESFRVFVPTG